MKILVTGATGFIGKRLCETLVQRGDDVAALSRNVDEAREKIPMVSSIVSWNPTGHPAPRHAFDGVDAIVHLLGESVGQKWNDEVKSRIRDSRVLGTRNLVEGIRMLDTKPPVLISGSAVGFYGDHEDEDLTEDSTPGTDFLAGVSKHWEAEGLRATEFGVRVVLLRTGVVLGKDGGALAQMVPPFKMGVGGPIGSGKQWIPWIHRDDMIGLILHAIDQQAISGPLNATAPNPVQNKEFAQVLGKVLHRPAILPTPVFALRMKFGEFADVGLLSSIRAIPKKAIATGYKYKFTDLETALRDILE